MIEPFQPTLNAAELPELFARFFALAPKDVWERRFAQLSAEAALSPFEEQFARSRLPIEIKLWRVHEIHRQFGEYGVEEVDAPRLAAYQFVWSFMRVWDRLSSVGRTRLEGMLQDALKQGFNPVAFEMATLIHLVGQGFEVDPIDLEGRGRCDYVISKNGFTAEIDCKSVSTDIGRPIHARQLYRFATMLWRSNALRDVVGGHVVRVTLPNRLTVRSGFQGSLAELVAKAVSVPSIDAHEAGIARHTEFEFADSPFAQSGSDQQIRAFLDELGIPRENSLIVRGASHAVLVTVSCAQPNKSADALYAELKKSAEKQFSGEHPAILAVELRDLHAQQILDMSERQGTWLPNLAARLTDSDKRQHLVGVAFMAAAAELNQFSQEATGQPILQNRGAAWLLPSPRHETAKSDMAAVFPAITT